MFKDYYLKFANEQEADLILKTEEGLRKYINTSVIGSILDQNNEPIEGWHVNVRVDTIIDELEPYSIYPIYPRQIWA